jgi:hypothetical protein
MNACREPGPDGDDAASEMGDSMYRPGNAPPPHFAPMRTPPFPLDAIGRRVGREGGLGRYCPVGAVLEQREADAQHGQARRGVAAGPG